MILQLKLDKPTLYYSLIYSVLFCCSLICFYYTDNLQVLSFFVGIEILATLLFSLLKNRWYSFNFLFLLTSCFFIYNCIFFYIIANRNFLEQTFPTYYVISKIGGERFSISSAFSVFFINLFYNLFLSSGISYIKKENVYFDKNIFKVGRFILLLFLIPALYKVYVQFKYLQVHGYQALFTGGLDLINYPFFCTGALTFFTCGYCLILSSTPKFNLFLKYTLIFDFVYILNGLKGQRGPTIAVLLISLYISVRYYSVKFNLKKIVVFIVFIVVLIIGLEKISDGDVSNKTNKSISPYKAVENMLFYQTTSRAVPLLVMSKNLEYHEYPFIFSPLTKYINQIIYPTKGQSRISAEKYNNISAVTMVNVSMNSYLNGLGYGSAFLAEAYDFFGYFGVIIFSILLSFLLYKFDSKTIQMKRIYIPLLYFVLVNLAILARGRIFGFLDYDKEIICTLIVYMSSKNLKKNLKVQCNE